MLSASRQNRDTAFRWFPCFRGSDCVKHFSAKTAQVSHVSLRHNEHAHTKHHDYHVGFFHGVRLKTGALSFALLDSERIVNAMMSRTIVTQVQTEVQAVFDRDIFGFCCQEDRI